MRLFVQSTAPLVRRFMSDLAQACRVISWLAASSPLAFGLVLSSLAQLA